MPLEIAIVPAGQWGTALAVPLTANGHRVRLWFRRPEEAAHFRRTRETRRLPGIRFGDGVTGTERLEEAVAGADLVVLAPASQGLRQVARAIRPLLRPGAILVSASKGLEEETLLRMSEVLAQEIPEAADRVAVISGPNFAVEVARGLPTGTVVAARDPKLAETVQDTFLTPRFRAYTSDDPIGVELGGALKNVIAMAVGVSDGLGLGHNTRATLITRGLAEMARLGMALGAQLMTFAGLSGVGDLVLTATGDLSRNRQAGLYIGRGGTLADFIRETGATVEGAPTARAARELAARLGVEMPITEQLCRILYDGTAPEEALLALTGREKRTRELEGHHPPAGR
ncbi:MAG: NAD(P)-dependent glycerol-3-phosphate dehydrogenase [Firmicutes bacterium]|nr:NAD(P)-dependent glycerol-3-phosphate dehydrogenase [Bacillota bacterium]